MKTFKLLWNKYKKYKNPVAYSRKLGVKIGNDCELRSTSFGSEPYLVTIGNHVRINSGVDFVTHDGGTWVLRQYSKIPDADKITLFGRIRVGNNVHIGTNAIIMPGVTIGDNCIIGCGAIVTKDIPANSVAVGIPARIIESIEEYEKKHMHEFCFTKHMSPIELKNYLSEKYEESF